MRAYVALFIGLAFMSCSAIFIRIADAPGVVTSFYRMSIASCILLIPFLITVLKPGTQLKTRGIILAVLAGICFGFDMTLWSTGIVASNATIPTIFANTAPIWVGIGSMIFFREKHKIGFWIGLLIAFMGILILLRKDLFAANGILYGSLMGAGAGFFYGIFQILSQPGRKLLNTLSYLFISTFSSCMVLIFTMFFFHFNFFGYSLHTYLVMLAYGIGVQVIGWFLINYSQGHIPASIVAPTLLGQPINTAILAAILLKEHLTIWHISGGIVIISGIYVIHFSHRRMKSKH